MSIASEISRLQTAKADLKAQIEAKGVTVDSAATLDSYASYVEEIPTGGGDENRLNLLLKDQITAITPTDVTGVTTITPYQFAYKDNLVSVNAPSVITISDGVFFSDNNLTSVTLTNVTNAGTSAFTFCTSLQEISLPALTGPGNGIFYGCSSLSTVTAPLVKGWGASAFQNCTSLSSLTTNCESVGGNNVFYGCTALTGITFTNPRFGFLSSGGFDRDLFVNCSSLEYLDFTNAASVPVISGSNALRNFPSTVEIKVPQSLYDSWTATTKWNTVASQIVAYPDVYTTNNLLYTTNNGNAITPSKAYTTVTQWGAGAVNEEYDATTGGTVTFYGPLEIPDEAYFNKTALTTVEIPDVVEVIGVRAFYGCSHLTAVTLSSGLTTIGGGAFRGTQLYSLDVPDGVSELRGILVSSTALTALTIGSGITKVGIGDGSGYADPVYGCTSLATITIKAVTPPTFEASTVFNGFGEQVPTTGTLYVPSGSESAYQSWIASMPQSKMANWTITAITE